MCVFGTNPLLKKIINQFKHFYGSPTGPPKFKLSDLSRGTVFSSRSHFYGSPTGPPKFKLSDLSRDTAFSPRSHVNPANTQISASIREVWSEFPLSDWRRFRSLATNRIAYAPSDDSDPPAHARRLIWDIAGRIRSLIGNAVPWPISISTSVFPSSFSFTILTSSKWLVFRLISNFLFPTSYSLL